MLRSQFRAVCTDVRHDDARIPRSDPLVASQASLADRRRPHPRTVINPWAPRSPAEIARLVERAVCDSRLRVCGQRYQHGGDRCARSELSSGTRDARLLVVDDS